MSLPRVTLVIPAHNEVETIHDVLEAVAAQDYPSLKVILVDDCSSDGTAGIARQFPGVRVISNQTNLGLARSMNVGLRASDADVLMVLHADCIPQTDQWVRQMVAPLADETVAAVVSQRKVFDRSQMGLAEKLFDAIAPQTFIVDADAPVDTHSVRDKCDAYRGDLLRRLHYFDDKAFFVSGEDTDLSYRIRAEGRRIVVSNEALVEVRFSSHQRSFTSVLWKKPVQYGGAAVTLWRRHRYDGLAARVFAVTWLVLVAIATSFFEPLAGVALCALALAINFPSGDVGAHRYSFGVVALAVAVPAYFGWVFCFFGTIEGVATLWSPPVAVGAVALPYLAYLVRRALAAARQSWRADRSVGVAILAFLFAIAWRLLSGLGYAGAWLERRT